MWSIPHLKLTRACQKDWDKQDYAAGNLVGREEKQSDQDLCHWVRTKKVKVKVTQSCSTLNWTEKGETCPQARCTVVIWSVSSVQFICSVASDSLRPMDCSMPGLPVHHQLPKFTQIHVHWVGDAIQPSHPLSSPSPPALNLSQHQGLFQGVSFHIRWLKYWSFSFSISPSNEHSGLISFRMDLLDLLAVQGTLKSLLQHHSSKESIL